jgi:predicted kinase
MMLIRRTIGPSLVIEVEDGDSIERIAEKVWFVGNRMGKDANGNAWPSNVRSMSMGDMVVIDEVDGQRQERVFTIAIAQSIGFRVETIKRVFAESIADPRSEQGERGPWADASDEVIEGMTEEEAMQTIERERNRAF